jgi:hypothetical protein
LLPETEEADPRELSGLRGFPERPVVVGMADCGGLVDDEGEFWEELEEPEGRRRKKEGTLGNGEISESVLV